MKDIGANKQGELDGLCGIYALTNYLRELKADRKYVLGRWRSERSDGAFWLILDTAERLRMFTVNYLLDGYAAHHLVRIWNELSCDLDLQAEAILLSRLQRMGKRLSLYDVSKIIIEDEKFAGAIFPLIDNHWVLCRALDGKGNLVVEDSAAHPYARSTLSRAMFLEEVSDGFAILPAGSSLLNVARNEP